MKILLLITGLGMGGAEQVVTGLADAFSAKGHEVCIAYMTGPAMVKPENTAIQLISLGMRSKKDVFRAFSRFKKLIMDFRPDVVHSHMIHANIFARLVRLVLPMHRLISTAHSSNEGGRLRMIAYRLTNRLANLSTNVSEAAVLAFERAGAVKPGEMLAITNGVSLEKFSFDSDARTLYRSQLLEDVNIKILLAVGRLEEVKDYPNLLNAIAQANKADVKFQLFIAGDGKMRQILEKMVSDLALTDIVKFLGVRRDVAALMSAADVFVLPSAWEGFGLVVAEAMACSRVVVATDCGGVREVLGSSGFLVPPKNYNALANKIDTALALSPAEAEVYGHEAYQRVLKNYSLDAAVDRWIKIYTCV